MPEDEKPQEPEQPQDPEIFQTEITGKPYDPNNSAGRKTKQSYSTEYQSQIPEGLTPGEKIIWGLQRAGLMEGHPSVDQPGELGQESRFTKGGELLFAVAVMGFGTIPFAPIVKVAVWSLSCLIFIHLAYRYFCDPKNVWKGLLAALIVFGVEIMLMWSPVAATLFPEPTLAPLTSLLDFHCQMGRSGPEPKYKFVISSDTSRLYKMGVGPPFWQQEPVVESKFGWDSATCIVRDDSPEPYYSVELSLAWQVVRSGEKANGLDKDYYPLPPLTITASVPLYIRFVNKLRDRAVAIAPTLDCYLQLPGDKVFRSCNLTRMPGFEAHDSSWKRLKEPPTFIFFNRFAK